MTMLRENFREALLIAIRDQEIKQRAMGYTSDSGFLAGLRQVLAALDRGEWILIE